MSDASVDKDLLFGVLAVSLDLVTHGQLSAAIRAWSDDRSKRLSQILFESGSLKAEGRELLEALVEEHLERHDHDAEKCLASLRFSDSVEHVTRHFAGVNATMDFTPGTDRADLPSTEPGKRQAAASSVQRYRILRPHARGGLGRVHVALDTELNREVALKELLERYADDPHKRCRFLVEAEITGSLEHPSIVPVYGLGKHPDSRPFYAMRFIRGESMKAAIGKFHDTRDGQDGHPGRNLELRRLLGHFIDACNAIHYAHTRGVVHRDIKPSNIMLGKFGETLMVDWGLAKTVGRTEEYVDPEERTLHLGSASGSAPTQMGSVIGTPAYMSPEQASGQLESLGPACDIYSLGSTLYHLLTGRPPVVGDDASMILQKVREGDYPGPRTVAPSIPKPLEAICLKAMALDPQKRYATARAMAEDIERWQADESVSAYRETTTERASRWMRRHRSWTQAGAIALAVVAIVSVAAAVTVNSALQNERHAWGKAAEFFGLAQGAVDTYLTGLGEGLKFAPGGEQVRLDALEEAARKYDQLVGERRQALIGGHVPESLLASLKTEQGRVYLRLGDEYRRSQKIEEAEAAYRSATDDLSELAEEYPEDPKCQLEAANASIRLGLLMAETGRKKEAAGFFGGAITRLRNAAKKHPGDVSLRDALAGAVFDLGVHQKTMGERAAAEESLKQALAAFEQLAEADPEETKYQAARSTVSMVLANLFVEDGRYREAQELLGRAIDSLDTVMVAEPKNPDHLDSRASTHLFLAGVLRRLGEYHKELAAYQRAIADYQTLAQIFPDVPDYQENVALTQTDLGQLLYKLGLAGSANEQLRQAAATFDKLAADFPLVPRYGEEQAASRDMLGQALADLGQVDDAQDTLQQAVRIYDGLAGAFPSIPDYRERLAVCRSHLARALRRTGQYQEAEESFQQAIELLTNLTVAAPEVHSRWDDLAFVYTHLATLLEETGAAVEADNALLRARTIREDLAANSQAPQYEHNLARFLVDCIDPEFRDPERASELAADLVASVPENAQYWSTLGAARYRRGQWPEAVEALQQAIQRRPKGHARDWLLLSMAQHQLGEYDQAKEDFAEGCRWMDENCPGNEDLLRIRVEAAELQEEKTE